MATAEATAPKPGPSIVVQLGLLLIMTAVAAGIGWFSGGYLNGTVPHEQASDANAAPAKEGGHDAKDAGHGEAKEGEGEHGEAAANGNPLVLTLAPITTNLAAPSDVWLRLELNIVLDAPPVDAELADTIHQDLLAFVRTVKMHQIEGASGFQHLKADLAERAAIRSDGHVKAVLIKTLLFE
jgi:flagellar FliL protein